MLGLAALDFQVCRKPPRTDHLMIRPMSVDPQVKMSANTLHLKDIEARSKAIAQREFRLRKKAAQERHQGLREQQNRLFQAKHDYVKFLAIKDRKSIISRSINWRVTASAIETEENSRLKSKGALGIWLWKLPSSFKKKPLSLLTGPNFHGKYIR